jgi:hypothetical protein
MFNISLICTGLAMDIAAILVGVTPVVAGTAAAPAVTDVNPIKTVTVEMS